MPAAATSAMLAATVGAEARVAPPGLPPPPLLIQRHAEDLADGGRARSEVLRLLSLGHRSARVAALEQLYRALEARGGLLLFAGARHPVELVHHVARQRANGRSRLLPTATRGPR